VNIPCGTLQIKAFIKLNHINPFNFMASGFLILEDGRCFSRRWSAHDAVLREVALSLGNTSQALALKDWILSLLPGPTDEEHVGYGPWFHAADQQLVERFLDIRELTKENQKLFHHAASQAGRKAQSMPDGWLKESLIDLADMVHRADRGEPPLSKSDWREVVASKGRCIGPGW
jgi:hypothetical protein